MSRLTVLFALPRRWNRFGGVGPCWAGETDYVDFTGSVALP